MAADTFLEIDGCKGETTDEKFKECIEVLSWSWGQTNAGSHGSGGGGGAGKVQMQDFHFVNQFGKHSPKLIEFCATGAHIPKAVLTCRKAGGKQEEYLVFEFKNLLISSYQTGCSQGSDRPTDQCSFNYTEVKCNYQEQKEDGSVGGNFAAGYDLAKNKKIA